MLIDCLIISPWQSMPFGKIFFGWVCSYLIKMNENNCICSIWRNETIYVSFMRENFIANVNICIILFLFLSSWYLFWYSTVSDYIATTQVYVWYAHKCNLFTLQWVTRMEHWMWFIIFELPYSYVHKGHLNSIPIEIKWKISSIFRIIGTSLAYNKILLWGLWTFLLTVD